MAFIVPLALGLLAAGTTVQTVGALKSARASRRVARAGETRERTRQFREARIQRARVESAAVQTGTQGGSAEIGALSSVGSQLASNVSFGQTISRLEQQRARARGLQAIGGGLAGLGQLGLSAEEQGLFN